MVPISIDVTGIVMEGLRRYDEWQRHQDEDHVDAPDVPRFSRAGRGAAPSREKLILAPSTVAARSTRSPSTHNPDFHVAKLVFDLLESGHVELSAEPPVAPPRSSELTPEDPYETVFAEAATPPFEGILDTADELNLPPSASARPERPAEGLHPFPPPRARQRCARPAAAGARDDVHGRPGRRSPAGAASLDQLPSFPTGLRLAPPAATGSFRATDRSAASFLEIGAPPASVPWPVSPPSTTPLRPAPDAGVPPAVRVDPRPGGASSLDVVSRREAPPPRPPASPPRRPAPPGA